MRKASFFAMATLATGALFISGCATKTWVQQQITPIDKKVADVDASSQKRDAQQVSDLGKTNQMVDEDAKKLSSTTEVARTAENQANGAMGKADKNTKDLGDLRSVIANIDDYKASGAATVVHFAIGKSVISKEDKAKLDGVASSVGSTQRYFITVEGYTDQTGSAVANDRLSRERADAVIAYLVGSHNIPVYRMHMVGLGQQKLIDEGKGKAAREASRRVEITVYTAKALTAGM